VLIAAARTRVSLRFLTATYAARGCMLQFALETRERGQQLACVPLPLDRVLLQAASDDRAQGRQRRHLDRARTSGGDLARQHLVEEHTERIDICPLVLWRTAKLLRRHVTGSTSLHPAPPERMGHPKVEDLHLTVLAQEYVPG